MNYAAGRRIYDRVYYRLESWVKAAALNASARRALRGFRPDKVFWDNFRQNVRPYWAQFGVRVRPLWFKRYYQMHGGLDPRLIPDDIHLRKVIPFFDKDMYIRPLVDKNLHALMFPGVKRPETVFKHIDGRYTEDDFTSLSREEALSRCLAPGRFIVKPTVDTGQGKGIRFFSGEDGREAVETLLASFDSSDYIVQKVVRQHPAMAHFNPGCLNTLRVNTMYFEGKAYILTSILRIGAGSSEVDNVSQGGYQVTVHPADGTLDSTAYTHYAGIEKYVDETDRGIRFEGLTIPCWDKISAAALRLCEYMPHLKYIGWDFAVDETGDVVLVEFNCQLGQNQETCGPTLGDMTEPVLRAIYGKKEDKA